MGGASQAGCCMQRCGPLYQSHQLLLILSGPPQMPPPLGSFPQAEPSVLSVTIIPGFHCSEHIHLPHWASSSPRVGTLSDSLLCCLHNQHQASTGQASAWVCWLAGYTHLLCLSPSPTAPLHADLCLSILLVLCPTFTS